MSDVIKKLVFLFAFAYSWKYFAKGNVLMILNTFSTFQHMSSFKNSYFMKLSSFYALTLIQIHHRRSTFDDRFILLFSRGGYLILIFISLQLSVQRLLKSFSLSPSRNNERVRFFPKFHEWTCNYGSRNPVKSQASSMTQVSKVSWS